MGELRGKSVILRPAIGVTGLRSSRSDYTRSAGTQFSRFNAIYLFVVDWTEAFLFHLSFLYRVKLQVGC